jgi:hypothetical protein
MAAYTLADYSALAKRDGAPLKQGVIDTLRKDSMIMDLLSFPSVGALQAKGLRIKSLPTLQHRKVNEGYVHSVGTFDPLAESGYLFGGKVQLDRVYDAAKGELMKDPQAAQIDLYLKSLAYSFNDEFFNNDSITNADTITGLRYRINTDFSGQKIDAGGVDVSPDTAAPTTAWLTLYDKMDALQYALPDHKADAFFMSDTTLLQIRSGLRRMGLLNQSKDQFGRTIDRWGQDGPMLLDAGVKADQTTRVLPNTETSAGVITGGTLSSIFAVRFGEDYLTGWQLDPLQTYKYQLGVIKYVELDWYVGLFITNPRSVAWLYNIQSV